MVIDRKTFYVVVHPEFVEAKAETGDIDAIVALIRIGQIPERQKGVIPKDDSPNFPYPVDKAYKKVKVAGAHILECEAAQENALKNAGWKDAEIDLGLSIYQGVKRR